MPSGLYKPGYAEVLEMFLSRRPGGMAAIVEHATLYPGSLSAQTLLRCALPSSLQPEGRAAQSFAWRGASVFEQEQATLLDDRLLNSSDGANAEGVVDHLRKYPHDLLVLSETVGAVGPDPSGLTRQAIALTMKQLPNHWLPISLAAMFLASNNPPGSKELDAALRYATKAHRLNPKSPVTTHVMLHVLDARGDLEGAYKFGLQETSEPEVFSPDANERFNRNRADHVVFHLSSAHLLSTAKRIESGATVDAALFGGRWWETPRGEAITFYPTALLGLRRVNVNVPLELWSPSLSTAVTRIRSPRFTASAGLQAATTFASAANAQVPGAMEALETLEQRVQRRTVTGSAFGISRGGGEGRMGLLLRAIGDLWTVADGSTSSAAAALLQPDSIRRFNEILYTGSEITALAFAATDRPVQEIQATVSGVMRPGTIPLAPDGRVVGR